MDIKKFSTPEVFGPGIWFMIHNQGLRANTDLKKEQYEINMQLLCDDFRCNECKTHFQKFIDSHPLIKYWKEENGFFRWSFELHNSVNKRLGKYQPNFEEALNYFSNSNIVCFNCH